MLNMRKILLSFLFVTGSLTAAPQAVVFDWGNVIATDDRSVIVTFMCKTFHYSESEFEALNIEKRKAVKAGKSDIDFWIHYAEEKGIQLPNNWPQSYAEILKTSVGADPEMYALINELKDQQIRVGLLSNINDRYTKLIRDFGFYQPFDPCLLSCEIGLEKPNRDAYEALIKAINLSAEEIVFIDDKPENVQGAREVGIDAILFESAEQVRRELARRGLVSSKIEGDRQMSYIKESQAKKFVVGIPIRTSNENGRFLQEVPPLWEKFYHENLAEKIPNRINHNLLTVYTDYEKDYMKPFTYIIGCEVSSLNVVPTGMIGLEIAPSHYSVFTANGDFPQSMGRAWQTIWNSDVKRTYTSDFEVYAPDFNPQNKPEIKIYIAID